MVNTHSEYWWVEMETVERNAVTVTALMLLFVTILARLGG